MGGYLMTAPGMIGFVIGFLLLDERDAGTLTALRVTPLSMRHYLAYRVAGTAGGRGTISTMIGYPLAGLSPIDLGPRWWPSRWSRESCRTALALVLATAAPNKVAGFAVVKVLNAVNLLPIAAFFIPVPLQYAAGYPADVLADARVVVRAAAVTQPYHQAVAVGAIVGIVW